MKCISKLFTLALTVVVLGYYSDGMKQELWLYTKEGYQLYFNTNYTNLTAISKAFPVARVCAIGVWSLCRKPNFTDYSSKCYLLTNTIQKTEKYCESYQYNNFEVQSLRPVGPEDTSVDSISFYSEPDFNGNETILYGPLDRALVGIIPEGSKSVMVTGKTSWTFFSEMFMNGSSVLLEPWPKTTAAYVRNMPKIGSALKECS